MAISQKFALKKACGQTHWSMAETPSLVNKKWATEDSANYLQCIIYPNAAILPLYSIAQQLSGILLHEEDDLGLLSPRHSTEYPESELQSSGTPPHLAHCGDRTVSNPLIGYIWPS